MPYTCIRFKLTSPSLNKNYTSVVTHFRLASLSAGMMEASDSSSSSCFNTEGAFMVTLLSRTVAPRFLPTMEVQ